MVSKRKKEKEALQEAMASGDRLRILYEAADLLYYSACLHEQDLHGKSARSLQWFFALSYIDRKDIDWQEAQAAALAKYAYRSAGNPDEAEELRLIDAAKAAIKK